MAQDCGQYQSIALGYCRDDALRAGFRARIVTDCRILASILPGFAQDGARYQGGGSGYNLQR